MSGSMFDFGLYFFHNAAELVKRGFGPYFYLPKMEHYLEVRYVPRLGFLRDISANPYLLQTLE